MMLLRDGQVLLPQWLDGSYDMSVLRLTLRPS